MNADTLTQATKRYRTLIRDINIRRGMRPTDEKLPANQWKKRFPELEAELLCSVTRAQRSMQQSEVPVMVVPSRIER